MQSSLSQQVRWAGGEGWGGGGTPDAGQHEPAGEGGGDSR